jgi:hypothetical protein
MPASICFGNVICIALPTVAGKKYFPSVRLMDLFLQLSKPVDFEKSILYLVIGDRVSTLLAGTGCPLLPVWVFSCNHEPRLDWGF